MSMTDKQLAYANAMPADIDCGDPGMTNPEELAEDGIIQVVETLINCPEGDVEYVVAGGIAFHYRQEFEDWIEHASEDDPFEREWIITRNALGRVVAYETRQWNDRLGMNQRSVSQIVIV